MEKLLKLLATLPPDYPATYIEGGEESELDLFFIRPERFDKFQEGYRFNPLTGEDLTGTEDGDWKKSWYVVGDIPGVGGDPLFTDIADERLPLYTAMHGAGRWDEIHVADSLYELPDKIKIDFND